MTRRTDEPEWIEEPTAVPNSCDECRTPTRLVQLTPGEDQRRRCASCHIAYLKRRMEADPISAEELARQKAKLRALLARWDSPERLRELRNQPSLFELRGVHPMRPRALTWLQTPEGRAWLATHPDAWARDGGFAILAALNP